MMQPPSRQSTPVTVRVSRPTLHCVNDRDVLKFEAAVQRKDLETTATMLLEASELRFMAAAMERGVICGLIPKV
jgi:hypothetical protein